MDEKYYNQLIDLCFIQSNSKNEKHMFLYLVDTLREWNIPFVVDNVGNILVTKGKSKTYPCIVSHIDTVHSFVKEVKVYTQKRKKKTALIATDELDNSIGIGGDDKCGVFACLYFLQILPAVKVVFFTQEECGCVGASKINLDFFSDTRYLLELDRRGSRDFIDKKYNQKTISQQFASEVGKLKKEYKFKSTQGSITDVVTLFNRDVGVSVVNISAGYYDPHTSKEYIILEDLYHSIEFTKRMIMLLKPKRYECKKKEIKTTIAPYRPQQIFCRECKKFKPKIQGCYLNGIFKCYRCLSADEAYKMCNGCYLYVEKSELLWSNKLKKVVCKHCRTKQQQTCIDCGLDFSDKHMHKTALGYVCYMCYRYYDTEICSMCNKQVPTKQGIFIGEEFNCDECRKITNVP